ncbi:hypothetical protein GCM10027610_098530 [Dactylosporangium cerinum]
MAGIGTVARPIGRSDLGWAPPAAPEAARGVPQPVQNDASGLSERPQVAQAGLSSAPHPPQNRSPSPDWRPQRAH